MFEGERDDKTIDRCNKAILYRNARGRAFVHSRKGRIEYAEQSVCLFDAPNDFRPPAVADRRPRVSRN